MILKFYILGWIKKYLPTRDEAAQYSPAVRKYRLNTDNIVRREGSLYHKRWTSTPIEKHSLQLLIPKRLRQEIIRNNHNTVVAGHFGVNKTAKRIKQRFHRYQMDADIK